MFSFIWVITGDKKEESVYTKEMYNLPQLYLQNIVYFVMLSKFSSIFILTEDLEIHHMLWIRTPGSM